MSPGPGPCREKRPTWRDSAEYRRGYAQAVADVATFLDGLPDGADERIALHLIELRELVKERFG